MEILFKDRVQNRKMKGVFIGVLYRFVNTSMINFFSERRQLSM